MNAREKHKQLGKQIIEIKKQMEKIYDQTKVKVKAGDVVESLDFGNGQTTIWFVFIDPWKHELCYAQVGSCGYNQIHDGYLHGTLVTSNGLEYVLAKLKSDGVDQYIIDTYKQFGNGQTKHNCLHQRFCQWCGQRVTPDMVD